MKAVHVVAGVVIVLAAAPPVRSDEAAAANAATSYRLYCASCHGEHGEGAPGARRPREHAPALVGLAEKYGARFPRERLVHFVMLDTRPGSGRVCGDRAFGAVPSFHGRTRAESAIVREALGYVASGGLAAPDEGKPAR